MERKKLSPFNRACIVFGVMYVLYAILHFGVAPWVALSAQAANHQAVQEWRDVVGKPGVITDMEWGFPIRLSVQITYNGQTVRKLPVSFGTWQTLTTGQRVVVSAVYEDARRFTAWSPRDPSAYVRIYQEESWARLPATAKVIPLGPKQGPAAAALP